MKQDVTLKTFKSRLFDIDGQRLIECFFLFLLIHELHRFQLFNESKEEFKREREKETCKLQFHFFSFWSVITWLCVFHTSEDAPTVPLLGVPVKRLTDVVNAVPSATSLPVCLEGWVLLLVGGVHLFFNWKCTGIFPKNPSGRSHLGYIAGVFLKSVSRLLL